MAKKSQQKGNRQSRRPESAKNGKKKRTGRRKRQIHIGIWSLAGILVFLAIALTLPHIRSRKSIETGAKVPPGAYCYGIDISHYQHKIIWDSLRVMTDSRRNTTRSKHHAKDIRPLSFVIIKATEGTSMKDKMFRKHWEQAEDSGIRKGAYHFFRSSKDPVQQAKLFIRTVGPIGNDDLPPVLDIETIHKGCSKDLLNSRALTWLKEVERHYGRKPIVYSSAYFIRDILSKEIKEHYPIWVAHYEKEAPMHEGWHIWQFSDKAVVYGIEGYVDLNISTPAQLEQL
jgi:lysozyme